MPASQILATLQQRVLFADGGMGTILQAKGLRAGEIPESWNLLRPGEIRNVHEAYFRAGSDFVLANTFGANTVKLAGTGLSADEVVQAAVGNARAAADTVAGEDGRRRFVALDVGPSGHLLKPNGDLAFDDAVACFARQIASGVAAGADLIVVETMADVYELKAAVLAAKENSDLPVFATVAFGADGKLLTGADVETVVAILEGLRVDVLGMNCGLGPHEMLPLVKRMAACSHTPVMVKPNAGLPRVVEGKTTFDVGPEEFAAVVADMVKAGASVLGGCCGTTPGHVAAEYAACTSLPLPVPVATRRCVVTSYTHTVELTLDDTVIIGERINPTGKSRLKQALREHDLPYLLREGVAQQEAGAHILDVNVGLPGIDEAAMMDDAVQAIQSVIDLPLQLDSSSPAVLERALRHYNGKALINSVNGKEETMRAVFPLAAKYGGVVIALALDEDGIPPTAEGRLAIARRILDRAKEYGLGPDDIVVDCLCMTVSAMPDAGRVTLDALRLLRRELGVRTCLGVSNVSFGLPARPLLNASFYTLALGAGLSAAIINPCKAEMISAYRCYRALMGQDAQFADFIRCASSLETVTVATGQGGGAGKVSVSERSDTPLANVQTAVRHGLKAEAGTAALAALKNGIPPLRVINEGIVPALDEVGRGFEAHTVFLPQLLMAAEAASSAFDQVKIAIAESGTARTLRGPVILATVKGDIHDIGKNIVRALLENYGFQVIDLGRDVPPETVLDAVRQTGCRLVGLSALMTTTVASMEETIALLHREEPRCKIIVGGAVLTADYANEIHADFYSKEAMETVRIAERFFESQP
ncbi:MAG: homocysteine S-methyltransferase family protein [Kiritimatiellae bacterium]|nr:homocysteine S-methyltransferase family protein [Kiritimatiellia bacterium]